MIVYTIGNLNICLLKGKNQSWMHKTTIVYASSPYHISFVRWMNRGVQHIQRTVSHQSLLQLRWLQSHNIQTHQRRNHQTAAFQIMAQNKFEHYTFGVSLTIFHSIREIHFRLIYKWIIICDSKVQSKRSLKFSSACKM